MKHLRALFVVFFLVLILGGANASATLINVDALNNTNLNPVTQYFEAGTYTATVIGYVDGGVYNSWNAWGNTTSDHGWLNSYRISSIEFDEVISIGDGIRYKDELEALDNAIDVTFTLLNAANVNFYIGDSYYDDNIGGISLNVEPVPEPSTILLFATGLLLVGIHGRKKLKK